MITYQCSHLYITLQYPTVPYSTLQYTKIPSTLGNQIIRDDNFNYIKCIIINFIKCILFFNETLIILTVVLYIAPAKGQEPFGP